MEEDSNNWNLEDAVHLLVRYRNFFKDNANKTKDFVETFLKNGPVEVTKNDIVAIDYLSRLGLLKNQIYGEMMAASMRRMFETEPVVKLLAVSCKILSSRNDPDGLVIEGKSYPYEIVFECVDARGSLYLGSCLFNGKRSFYPYRYTPNAGSLNFDV